MPIKGLSDERRLPRAGKIHLGIMKTSSHGNEYPSATDYFVVSESETTMKGAAEAFAKAYPGQPRELEFYFPHLSLPFEATKEMIFPQYYKQYGAGTGLKCKGDGERATRWDLNPTTGEVKKIECPCAGPETCQFVKRMSDGAGGQKGDCGPMAHLQVLLPKVAYLGVWQIDTGSINSIIQINSDLALINGAAGRISNIPLTLRLVPRQVSPGGKKKTVFTMTISYTGTMMDLAKFRTGDVNINPALLGGVDDSEIPEDIRPPALLNTHPLSAHLTGSSATPPPTTRQLAAPASTAPASSSADTPFFDAAFGPAGTSRPPVATQTTEVVEDTLIDESPLNESQEVDPIEDSIRFHSWRLGMTDVQREKARRLHRDPAGFLDALQRQPTNALRAQTLYSLGYDAKGFNFTTGEAGGPHVVKSAS